jgi:hypothetical protein
MTVKLKIALLTILGTASLLTAGAQAATAATPAARVETTHAVRVAADADAAKDAAQADRKADKAAMKADRMEDKAAMKADRKEDKAAMKADRMEDKTAMKADKKADAKAMDKGDK